MSDPKTYKNAVCRSQIGLGNTKVMRRVSDLQSPFPKDDNVSPWDEKVGNPSKLSGFLCAELLGRASLHRKFLRKLKIIADLHLSKLYRSY